MTKPYSYSKLWLFAPLLLGLILVIIMAFYWMWWHLPASINRYGDIKKGNKLIERTEAFERQHGLPETNDWITLRRLGYEFKGETLVPDNQKLNDSTFELVFLEGFDGPYLMWHSKDQQWKNAFPTYIK